jgi:hypothetical protein
MKRHEHDEREHDLEGTDLEENERAEPAPRAPGKRTLFLRDHDAFGRVSRKGRPGASTLTQLVAERMLARARGSSGVPLPDELRRKFERSLGVDLSDVRIHGGERSAAAAEAIGARAYTVGQDVHFGAGELDLAGDEGQRLLAHEVAHTVQDGPAAGEGPLSLSEPHDHTEQEADLAAEAMVAGRRAPALARALEPEVRRVLSPQYPQMRAQLSGGSVTAAQVQTVLGLLDPLNEADLGDTVAQLERDHLIEPLLDNVPAAERTARAPLLARITRWRGQTSQLAHIRRILATPGAAASSRVLDIFRWNSMAQERVLALAMEREGLFPAFLNNISPAERAAQAALIARIEGHRADSSDRERGTDQIDQTQRDEVQAILNRGASGVPPGAAFRDVDPVSGLTYREHIMQTLDARRTTAVPRTQAMFARPRIPLTRYETIGGASKRYTDDLFGRYASGPALTARGPNPNIRDQSAITGNAADMIDYLIHSDAQMQPVHRAHNARTGQPTERGIIRGVMADYFTTRSGVSAAEAAQREADMRLIDRGWPATAGGGVVRVQPYEGATPADTRRSMWKSFQTLIHEYLHTITHTRYDRAARALPSREQQDILVEGGTSLYTDKVWNTVFPEEIRNNDALRATVEGSSLPFDETVIPTITHYRQIAQAREIESQVGEENLRAAYFLGQIERIGLGHWTAALDAAEGRFTVPAGMTTLAAVATATGATEASIAAANGVPAGSAVTTGQVLVVPGLRTHVAAAGETLAQIAQLSGVTLAAIRAVNPSLPTGRLTGGTSVTIPVH